MTAPLSSLWLLLLGSSDDDDDDGKSSREGRAATTAQSFPFTFCSPTRSVVQKNTTHSGNISEEETMINRLLVVFVSAVLVSLSEGWVQPATTRGPASSATSLAAAGKPIVTGPKGQAAKSSEEDLMLTLQVIMDHDKRSTTVSKEQYIQQMQDLAKAKSRSAAEEKADVSVPYDAAARRAYEASDKSVPYEQFKAEYESDAAADAAAKLSKRKRAMSKLRSGAGGVKNFVKSSLKRVKDSVTSQPRSR